MTPADKLAVIEGLLGRPESTCETCGQSIPESPGLITQEQARELLNCKGEENE